MVFQDSTNLNNISKYIVDSTGATPYVAIQAAINAANTAGVNATVYIRPGTYTEDLTLYDGIDLEGKNTNTIIIGTHIPPPSGSIQFFSLTLQDATDIFNSAVAGTTSIELFDCIATCTNGYVYNLLNWTGNLTADIVNFNGTNNGVVNNTGGATVFISSASVGIGTGNSMIVSGTTTFENVNVRCPISFQGTGTSIARMGCTFNGTITTAATNTVSIDNSAISTGATAAISHGSGNALTLSNVTIDSTNATPIGGTGTINEGSIDFLNNTTMASTLTIVSKPTMNRSMHGWNGSTLEDSAVTVTSDGATITLSIQQKGGGDLTIVTSTGFFDWDTSPAVTISLMPGSDTAPLLNFVYWLESTRLLTVNNTGFPSAEHLPVAVVYCQSAASLQTDGAYKVHAWTDHLECLTGQGHIGDISHWIRHQPATWKSGVDPTLTITPQGGAADDVIFTSLVGEIAQLHDHAFPAFAGTPDVYTVNDFTTPFNVVTDLNALLTDSANVSMSGRFFSLVIWGVVSEDTGDCKLMVNLPSGSYNTSTTLLADASKFTSFSIPTEFVGTGFLIAQLNLRHTVAASGTWTQISLIDLRGQLPSTAAGGSVPAAVEFPDNTFRIFDNADGTRKIAFQASGITTGTVRTITMDDRDIDMDAVATSIPTDAGTATPAAGSLTVTGGTNINTAGAGSTVTVNLDGTVSIAGSMTAGTGLSTTTGDVTSTAGNFNLPATTAALTAGVLEINSIRVLHSFGTNNVFVGDNSGNGTMTGVNNTGVGVVTLDAVTSGSSNVAIGLNSLTRLTTGSNNTAMGWFAGENIVGGGNNVIIGSGSFGNLSSGSFNTSLGTSTGAVLTGGSYNILIGNGAGGSISTTNSSNILIGHSGVAGYNNKIRIGTQGVGAGQQNNCFIAGIHNVTPSAATELVIIDANGEMGSTDTPVVTSIGFGDEVLANYDEGTWTPAFAFGGGTTGITYGVQTGSYTRIGNRVFITGSLTLTNKGSSSGDATITGLPFTSNEDGPITVLFNLIDLTANYTNVVLFTNVTSTIISIHEVGDNVANIAITDADFGNTSSMLFRGTFRV